ncbi:MAG TPA: peptide ABC transporter, partial [Rhodospirillaceae bacterium]|nr:peptide ABC transporter [Rhodospirillaceae bacterium]
MWRDRARIRFRRWTGLCAILIALAAAPLPATAAPKDTLVIGISQFPNNFNPLIDSMLAKSYMLAFARRRITIYDSNWKLICMLCDSLG